MTQRDREARALLTLTEKIRRGASFDAASYKPGCLRRRIAVRMRARGAGDYSAYAQMLDADPAEYERLVDVLTINVTRLWRNPDTWRAVARQVLPELWNRPARRLLCWVAGCSSGEEAWTLAALWDAFAASRHSSSGDLPNAAAMRYQSMSAADRVRIVATDIDRASLVAAARGTYPASAFGDVPAKVRSTAFGAREPYSAGSALRAMVTFERRDLLLEPPPNGPIHLITCRNVIIYLNRKSQDALFGRMHAALAPEGLLVLGKVETMLGAARDLFAAEDQRHRIFRKR